jgi:glutamine cyclotransferase
MGRMVVVVVVAIALMSFAYAEYREGVLLAPAGSNSPPTDQFTVIDSFPSNAPSYSMGLAFDGEYLWNDEAFAHWFAHIDTGGYLISTFTPSYGNRDMTFDGTYLWATDWQQAAVYKYDTSTCAIVSSFSAPFSGKPNGMAWDGIFL